MKSHHPDYYLLGTVALLILIGFMMLGSVASFLSLEQFGTAGYYLNHQLIFGLLLGVIGAAAAYFIPLRFFRRFSHLFLAFALFLMIMVFVPYIGYDAGGSHRWLNLGFGSFQPSELLKIVIIIYLATWLAKRTEGRTKKTLKSENVSCFGPNTNTFVSFLAIIGLTAILIALQKDLSTLGVIFLIAVVMYFIAGTPLKHMPWLIGAGAAGLTAMILFASYRFSRLLIFLHPETDPMGRGYQIQQALIAVGSGGILGVGIGAGRQQYGFLPQSIGDSIFAIFAEEVGFVGCLILIAIFSFLAVRIFLLIKRAPDMFSKLVATGVLIWISAQTIINMGAMIQLVPLTGIPLPFISYGGSALISELIAVGLLLNISRYTHE